MMDEKVKETVSGEDLEVRRGFISMSWISLISSTRPITSVVSCLFNVINNFLTTDSY